MQEALTHTFGDQKTSWDCSQDRPQRQGFLLSHFLTRVHFLCFSFLPLAGILVSLFSCSASYSNNRIGWEQSVSPKLAHTTQQPNRFNQVPWALSLLLAQQTQITRFPLGALRLLIHLRIPLESLGPLLICVRRPGTFPGHKVSPESPVGFTGELVNRPLAAFRVWNFSLPVHRPSVGQVWCKV